MELREVGLEVGVSAAGSSGGDLDSEASGVFEIFFHHLGRVGPVFVVVLAVDNQRFERLSLDGGGEEQEGGGEEEAGHGGSDGVMGRRREGRDDRNGKGDYRREIGAGSRRHRSRN